LHHPAAHAATGQPGRKDLVMMLSPRVIGLFMIGRAARFGGPNDPCIVEHAACFRSVINAAIAWSTFWASGPCVAMSPCASQLFDEPTSINSMNRTPRPANRRATRHCQPKPVFLSRLNTVQGQRR
jgi:hypothetical protein